MKAEDLFIAIGQAEDRQLLESEPFQEGKNMKKASKLIRNLLIAAVLTALLSITVYAAVNARIQLNVTKRQEETTNAYEVEIDFQRTSNEYLEL